MFGVSLNEKENFEKLREHEFPWTLVEDRKELRRYWPSFFLPNVDPLVVVLIDPNFPIFSGIFCFLGALNLCNA